MKKQFAIISKFALGLLLVTLFTTACKKSEDDPSPSSDNMVTLQKQSLSGDNETPAVVTTATGFVESTYDKGSNTLITTINHYNITPTGAYIQRGFNGTGNGAVIKTLTLQTDAPIKDTVKLSDAEEDDLLQGKFYVNISTAANPNGEIRAQLITNNIELFTNIAKGGNEVADVTTIATSTFYGTFNKSTKVMTYAISYTGETPIGAHLHNEFAGKNGDIIFSLATPTSGSTITGYTIPFSDAQAQDLEAGKMYYNVHTNTNKTGELRAQLTNGTIWVYNNIVLSSANETPVVISTATGRAFVTYNSANGVLNYNIITNGLNSASSANIETSTGTSVFTLATPINGTGDITTSGTITDVTSAKASALKEETLYVNIKTTTYPSGEIKGHIK